MEERFKKTIERVADPKDRRMNGMLNPCFLRCDSDDMTSEIMFSTMDWEKNQREEIHGGAIAAMFDTAMGITAATFRGESSVATADLQVSFIKPFLKGAFVFTTKVNSMGNTLIRTTCTARDKESDLIVATATGTFVPYKKG